MFDFSAIIDFGRFRARYLRFQGEKLNLAYFPCPGGSPFLTVKLARPSSDSNLNRVSGGSSERIVSCESSVNSVNSFGSLGGCATSICYDIFGGVCV